ncbi:MAG: hypothetical protein HC890_19090 [Chloroflexaceae bacterium]|nr:hypothetical protein [Chloroflexaceae bacterium]
MLKKAFVLATMASTLVPSVTIAQTSARSNYRVINVSNFVSQKQISGLTPNQAAVKLFGYQGEEEGRRREQIAVTYSRPDTAIVLLTKEGLADDSLFAIKSRIEMRRAKNRWQVIWVGEQYKCHQGRGSQNWSAKLCS